MKYAMAFKLSHVICIRFKQTVHIICVNENSENLPPLFKIVVIINSLSSSSSLLLLMLASLPSFSFLAAATTKMLESQNAHKFVNHLTIYGSFYLQLFGWWLAIEHSHYIKYVYTIQSDGVSHFVC